MGLLSKRTAQQPAQESSTFFAAASHKPKDEEAEKAAEPTPVQPKVTPQEQASKPARTFFDTGRGHTRDPLLELSTHRPATPAMSDEERAARKAFEEIRARTGLERLHAMIHRK